MKKPIWMLMVCIVVMLPLQAIHTAPAGDAAPLDDQSIAGELQRGGYLLYMRHGEAAGQDQPGVDFEDCSKQRNLTLLGSVQAGLIGERLRKLQIPVQTPVLASPYCRTRETAELAFGKPNVEVMPHLAQINVLSSDERTNEEERIILKKLAELFEIPVPQGSNLVIVGHTFPAGKGLGEIPFMGTVVIKPNGAGKGYEIIRRIRLDEWTDLFSKQADNNSPDRIGGVIAVSLLL
ncbi:histidine phosphatase family protein [Paenibacillus solisilvae]|uniref:Histidine phosphatase family protein n=1 Tax=Paenibacillus solisilvae TaxID=2486751 RepID=A0ABW0VWD6_9BACL